MDVVRLKVVLTVLIAILTAGALISAAGVLVAVSAGAWENSKASIGGVADLTRVISGAVSAFVFAVGVSLFAIRRQVLGLGEDLSAIEFGLRSLKGLVQPEIDGVLKHRDSLEPWTAVTVGRKSIFISGMSLRTLSTEYTDNLRDVLGGGGTCRFLLVEPGSESSSVVARNFLGQDDPSDYNSDIRRSLERLRHLRDGFPGRVEIRTLNHVPTSSITILDQGLPTGKIFVEFYMYEDSSVRRPHLEMSAQNSPVWYWYFQDQFEKMWSAGTTWERS